MSNHACITEYSYFADQLGSISPKPTDQRAMEGDLVLFRCQYSLRELVPFWSINGVTYLPSNLPADHWVNSSGLVVRAQVENNRTSFQCQFNIFLSSINGFVTINSSPLAYLTVTRPTGVWPDGNQYYVCSTFLLSLLLVLYTNVVNKLL